MKDMRRGWLHLASGAGLGRIFGFFSNLLLSRWLGPSDLGLFNLVTTTVQTSDTIVRCGGDYALNFELGGQLDSTHTESGTDLARGLSQLCSLATLLICVSTAIWVWCGQGLFPLSIVSSHRLTLTALLLLMIACEGISASAWEILLVSHRTGPLALRQGLFFPLRLLLAAVGALFASVLGAMIGWSFVAALQCVWLKQVLGNLWSPFRLWPFLERSLLVLLRRGLPFYAANLLSAMIFYPLLLMVASGAGLAEIGYLRVGQILQQLFAFLPTTLVPLLFLRMRGEPNFRCQVSIMEQPFRLIWFILLELLLLYCLIDQLLVESLFGSGFIAALIPTRLLLATALFECLAQLLVQPLLAAGKTRIYGIWQNATALMSALLGWLWIPSGGLGAFLAVRLLYVIVPLVGFGNPVLRHLNHPEKLASLAVVTISLLSLFLYQIFFNYPVLLMPPLIVTAFVALIAFHRHDLVLLPQLLRNKR